MADPTESSLPLLAIQRAITAELARDAWFDQIPIINDDVHDIPATIELAAQKLGSCVVIETPECSRSEENLPPAYLDRIDVDLLCYEQVQINRKKNADGSYRRAARWAVETAQVAYALLQHWTPINSAGTAVATVLFNRTPVIKQEFDPDYVLWVLRMSCAAGFTYVPQQSLKSGNNQTLLSGLGLPLTRDRQR